MKDKEGIVFLILGMWLFATLNKKKKREPKSLQVARQETDLQRKVWETFLNAKTKGDKRKHGRVPSTSD